MSWEEAPVHGWVIASHMCRLRRGGLRRFGLARNRKPTDQDGVTFGVNTVLQPTTL